MSQAPVPPQLRGGRGVQAQVERGTGEFSHGGLAYLKCPDAFFCVSAKRPTEEGGAARLVTTSGMEVARPPGQAPKPGAQAPSLQLSDAQALSSARFLPVQVLTLSLFKIRLFYLVYLFFFSQRTSIFIYLYFLQF